MGETSRYALAFVCLTASLACIGTSDSASAGTQIDGVVFTDYTPLSSNMELARRFLTPLTSAQMTQTLSKSGTRLREQPVDLAEERFVVYVPATKPANGYGLLVFVPPWDVAKLPVAWSEVLDQHGMIYVSAANSGNDNSPLGRREPLALLAEANVVKRYPVDPSRIYVGGFSGGSRIAMRLALAYPDVFRGALLNSGSDPIGDHSVSLPPRDLFLRFQQDSRLVYVTGEDDTMILQTDRVTQHTMHEWCAFNEAVRTMRNTGHDAADPATLSWALDMLDRQPAPDPNALAQCRAGIDEELAGKFRQADALAANGKRDEAKALLKEIDLHYGGLAAPRSVELEAGLEK